MSTPWDADKFRRMLGNWATGVTVITSTDPDGTPAGFACNSFTSVSLDPPLVLFCIKREASSLPAIQESKQFRVNVLEKSQRSLCRQFTAKDTDRFAGVPWHEASAGPALDEAVATIGADVVAMHDGGDHLVVVGRVIDFDVRADGGPLVFFRGQYGSFVN